jgi:hypothetical protein
VTYTPDRGLECSCPDYIHRLRECKHQRTVLRGAVEPAPPPAPLRDLADLYGDRGAAPDRALATRKVVAEMLATICPICGGELAHGPRFCTVVALRCRRHGERFQRLAPRWFVGALALWPAA